MSVSCPICSTPTADDARFCTNCGVSLVEECASCGAAVVAGSRFCPSCGSPTDLDPETATGGLAERKVVSVLFVDLVGFTAHAAESDPEEVRSRLTVYHREIREDVERFGGRVEKLMGDGVFAVFGAPAAHEDDPERAVRAALRMQRSVDDLNAADPELALSVRIAVTTGEAIVQLAGADRDREGIIGDVVNMASRLESVAAPGSTVVDERTYLSTRDVVLYGDLDPVIVKGKVEPLTIWQPLEVRSRFGVAVDRRHATPFVGRKSELGGLVDAFDRAVGRSTIQLITIIGEAGVGKSRLLHEFREQIDSRPDLAWWRQGRCLPYGEGITFWALAEIVKAHAGILDSDPAAITKLGAAIRPLFSDSATAEWVEARLAPLAGIGGTGQAVDEAELFSAWSQFFEALAARNPLILAVEDLHWADEAMLDFLEHLTDWAVSSPILVVVTARPELFSLRSGWGGGKRNAATVTLPPLSDDQSAVLLGALLEATVLDASVQQAILTRSEGNPLYMTEFVRLADEKGLLRDAAAIADSPLPSSVQAIVAARLDLLEPADKSVLQAAAVVGKVFWMGALQSLRPALAPSTVLRDLIRRELIRPVRDPSMQGQQEYAFSHNLIRDVAYGQISRAERAQLHTAAAGWIEAVTGTGSADSTGLIAYHLGEAMQLSVDPTPELRLRSFHATMQAGDRARGINPTRGAAYYRAAASMIGAGKERARALLELGRLMQDADQIRPTFEEALALYREAGDIEGQALVLDAIAGHLWWRGDTVEALASNLKGMELAADLPPGAAKARVLVGYASALYLRGRAAEALEVAETAASVVAAAGIAEEQIRLLYARGGSLVELGDQSGFDYLENAVSIALDRNMAAEATIALNNLATVVAQMRSTSEGLVQIEKAIALADERGLVLAANWSRFTKSEIMFPAGMWDEVLEVTERVTRLDAEIGGSQAGPGASALRAMVLFYRSREDEARTLFGPVLEAAREIGDQQVLAPILSFAVVLAGDAGDDAEVLALSEEYAETTAEAPAFRSYYLGDVARSLAASRHIGLLERVVETSPPFGAVGEIQVARAQGVRAFVRGDIEDAAGCFARAASLGIEAGRLVDVAAAQIEHARALVAIGRGEEASALLAEAMSAAKSMKATKMLGWIDEIDRGTEDRAVGG